MFDCSLGEHGAILGTPKFLVNRHALRRIGHPIRMKTLADRAVFAREKVGLKPAEAARLIGIKQPSLWAIENGVTRTLKGKTLTKMAEVYGVNERWLEQNVGDMEPDKASARAQAQQIARDWEQLPVFMRHYLKAAIQDVVDYAKDMSHYARESMYGTMPEDGDAYIRMVNELEDGIAKLRFQRTSLSTDDGRQMIKTVNYFGANRRGSVLPPRRPSEGKQ